MTWLKCWEMSHRWLLKPSRDSTHVPSPPARLFIGPSQWERIEPPSWQRKCDQNDSLRFCYMAQWMTGARQWNILGSTHALCKFFCFFFLKFYYDQESFLGAINLQSGSLAIPHDGRDNCHRFLLVLGLHQRILSAGQPQSTEHRPLWIPYSTRGRKRAYPV